MSRRTRRRAVRQHPRCATCRQPIRDRDRVTRIRGGWAHTTCTTKARTP